MLFNKRRQLIPNRFSPPTYKNYELVNIPANTSTGYLSIVSFEFGVFMFGLGSEEFFCPHLAMKVRIIDEWQPFVSGFFYHLGDQLLFTHAEKAVLFYIIPENTAIIKLSWFTCIIAYYICTKQRPYTSLRKKIVSSPDVIWSRYLASIFDDKTLTNRR